MLINKLYCQTTQVLKVIIFQMSQFYKGWHGKFYKGFWVTDHYSVNHQKTKCPRCGDLGGMVEDSPIRTLFKCPKCGIFAKYKPRERIKSLNQAIERRELTKILEILEIAGHRGEDAIASLNLYREIKGGARRA
jgi:ribosomal protein S27AE